MYTITDQDIAAAQSMGQYRAEQSRLKGYSQSEAICSSSAETLAHADFVGALGEVVFAKILGEPDQLAEGTLKAADHVDRFGTKWHIRSTDRAGGSLIVRDRDPRGSDGHFLDRYALVEIDLAAKTAQIAGWKLGKMVQCSGSYEARGNSAAPAYWIGQKSLKPIEDYLERKTSVV